MDNIEKLSFDGIARGVPHHGNETPRRPRRRWPIILAIAVMAALLAVFSQFIVGSPLMLGVIVITNGMPVATNGTLFCVRYGGDLEAMTQTTFISTVLSLVSIPLFAMLIA